MWQTTCPPAGEAFWYLNDLTGDAPLQVEVRAYIEKAVDERLTHIVMPVVPVSQPTMGDHSSGEVIFPEFLQTACAEGFLCFQDFAEGANALLRLPVWVSISPFISGWY